MFFDDEIDSYIYSKQREINKKLENIKNFNYRDEYFERWSKLIFLRKNFLIF
jgi:hypothetical protein